MSEVHHEEWVRLSNTLKEAQERATQGDVQGGAALLQDELRRAREAVEVWEQALRLFCQAYDLDEG